MSDGKKVLMICGHEDLRSYKFAEYMTDYGWSPVVVSIRNSIFFKNKKICFGDLKHVKLLRTWNLTMPLELVAASRFSPRLFDFPDVFFGWIPFAVLLSLRTIRTEKIDLVYVSCSPYSGAIAGAIVKRFTKLPLIIDIRDPWAENEYFGYPTPVHKKVNDRMEKWAFERADVLTMVTETDREIYEKKYPGISAKVQVVPNGFDFGDSTIDACPVENERSDKLSITYLGSIYGKRLPLFELFIKSYKTVFSSNPPDSQLFLIGCKDGEITSILDHHGLKDHAVCTGMLPQKEAFQYLHNSCALVLLESSKSTPGKAFEYLASGKPIFALVRDGELSETLKGYAKNSYIITSFDEAEVQDKLREMYKVWKEGGLTNNDIGVRKEIYDRFSRKKLCEKMIAIFNRLV